jgi:hypothetical protein
MGPTNRPPISRGGATAAAAARGSPSSDLMQDSMSAATASGLLGAALGFLGDLRGADEGLAAPAAAAAAGAEPGAFVIVLLPVLAADVLLAAVPPAAVLPDAWPAVRNCCCVFDVDGLTSAALLLSLPLTQSSCCCCCCCWAPVAAFKLAGVPAVRLAPAVPAVRMDPPAAATQLPSA